VVAPVVPVPQPIAAPEPQPRDDHHRAKSSTRKPKSKIHAFDDDDPPTKIQAFDD
jgi:hypothetical protein